MPPEQLPGILRAAGVDPSLADALGELHQLYRPHLAGAVTDEVLKATGRPARSLKEWLTENSSDFTA